MIISKKKLITSLFMMGTSLPLSIQAMQNPNHTQRDFSELAFCQSTALWTFGALTHRCGKQLDKTFDYTASPVQRSISAECRMLGKTSIGLGLLSALYIINSKYKRAYS